MVEDLKELLRELDEISILEILDVTTEDLLDAFEYRIHERRDYIEQQLQEPEDGEGENPEAWAQYQTPPSRGYY